MAAMILLAKQKSYRAGSMSYSIVATAKNEGPFLIEWLAHHFAIGFDRIFIATNDCEDGTDEILDLLSHEWPVFRIENNQVLKGCTFQRSAVRRGLAHPELSDQDWAMHIDLDEFLNLKPPYKSVGEFMSQFSHADAVLFSWRLFGDNGQRHWDGGSVLDAFLTCQEEPDFIAHKAIFRTASFADCAPHSPKSPRKPIDNLVLLNSRGVPLDGRNIPVRHHTALNIPASQNTWHGACINHYVHKSQDLATLVLHKRGDANGRKRAARRRVVGSPAYNAMNRNEVEDISISRFRNMRIDMQTRLLATPGVLEAHYASHRWFVESILEIRNSAEAKAGLADRKTPNNKEMQGFSIEAA